MAIIVTYPTTTNPAELGTSWQAIVPADGSTYAVSDGVSTLYVTPVDNAINIDIPTGSLTILAQAPSISIVEASVFKTAFGDYLPFFVFSGNVFQNGVLRVFDGTTFR